MSKNEAISIIIIWSPILYFAQSEVWLKMYIAQKQKLHVPLNPSVTVRQFPLSINPYHGVRLCKLNY